MVVRMALLCPLLAADWPLCTCLPSSPLLVHALWPDPCNHRLSCPCSCSSGGPCGPGPTAVGRVQLPAAAVSHPCTHHQQGAQVGRQGAVGEGLQWGRRRDGALCS